MDKLNDLTLEALEELEGTKKVNYDTYFGEMDLEEDEKEKRKRLAKRLELLFLAFFLAFLDGDKIFSAKSIKSGLEQIILNFLGMDKASARVDDYTDKLSKEVVNTTWKNALGNKFENIEEAEKHFKGIIEDVSMLDKKIPDGDFYIAPYTLISTEDDKETEVTKQGDIFFSENGEFEKIESTDFNTSLNRATLIAANSANAVGNYRQLLEAIKTGRTQKKWITMRDNRVRHTHIIADGQTVGIFEPFVVGDSYMNFPKDESLGAEMKEIAGCRCVCEYL